MVLLDVQMPVLDGYEVVELIRGREKSRAVPIIFLTAIHRDQRLVLSNVHEILADAGQQRAAEHVWFLHGLGVSSYICWPLFIRDRIFGSLVFLNRDPERHYLESDVELAKDVAGRMATALDNMALFELAQSERAKLQDANRAKDMFLATVSHEFRTPLNAVVGWGQLLRGGGLSKETEQRAIATIERNGRALAQLAADLLDVSRVVSGNLHVDEGQVALRGIVEAALDAARPVAVAAGSSWRWSCRSARCAPRVTLRACNRWSAIFSGTQSSSPRAGVTFRFH